MATQVDLPLERFVAQAALEWLVTGVLTHVCDQIAALGERLATHHALMRLLTCNRFGGDYVRQLAMRLISVYRGILESKLEFSLRAIHFRVRRFERDPFNFVDIRVQICISI